MFTGYHIINVDIVEKKPSKVDCGNLFGSGVYDIMESQGTYDVMKRALLCVNDVATSLWRHDYAIIVSWLP